MYGTKIEPTRYVPRRSVIGEAESSPSGNLVLRVGRENPVSGTGWCQTEHVVMEPDEAREFAHDILAEVGEEVLA